MHARSFIRSSPPPFRIPHCLNDSCRAPLDSLWRLFFVPIFCSLLHCLAGRGYRTHGGRGEKFRVVVGFRLLAWLPSSVEEFMRPIRTIIVPAITCLALAACKREMPPSAARAPRP